MTPMRRPAWGRDLSLLLLVTVVALMSLGSGQSDGASRETPNANAVDLDCYTEGCNRTATDLVHSMNASADPCEDFFAFACGGYVKNTPLPPPLHSVNTIFQMEERLRAQINELLSEPIVEREPAAFKKAKTLYSACIDITRLEELGLEPARTIMATLGGWPMLLDEWDETKFDWLEMSYKIMDLGSRCGGYLFDISVSIDITNTTKHSLVVGTPDFNLDLQALDEEVRAWRSHTYIGKIVNAARMFQESDTTVPVHKTRIFRESRKTAAFEMELNNRTKSLEDRQNLSLVAPMNVSALQSRYPFVPWLDYMRRLLPWANVTEAEVVLVTDTEYLDALGAILDNTSKKTLANFMVWRAMEEFVFPYLNAAFRKEFVESDPGRMGRMGRWDECVKLVQQGMRIATSAMYVRRHSSEDARRTAREMVQDIRKEMYRLLEAVDWMDPSTKRAAMMKADAMRYNVAFPDELLNDTVLDEFYKGVEVHGDDLVQSVLSLERAAHRDNARRFHETVKKQDWTYISGLVDFVNAFYNFADNSMSIPAAILQGRFFQRDRPQYMNYGGIGFAIGHEVSHGFDETGSLFNVDGMMENWWDKETKKLFDEKVRCIVDQYSGLKNKDTNISVNGLLTRGENIADNAGLKLAYRAYRRFTERRGEEPRVNLQRAPTLRPARPARPAPAVDSNTTETSSEDLEEPSNLTLKPRQLFWVSFASVWCSKETPKELYRMLRTSAHLPGVYRVNGAVRNQHAFAADFNCPVGSPMNPAHKCQVW